MSPTSKKKPTSRPRRGSRVSAKPRKPSKPARSASASRRAARAATSDHPLGEGVADGFALRRLNATGASSRKPQGAVREISWAAFGDASRTLAARIGESFLPDVVLGVAKGGVFVGGALSAALDADFVPVRLEKRRRDTTPVEALPQIPDLRTKRVLVVDDVASTGATLARARALARKAGARDVKTAVLVVRPGGARPDWFALETDDLVLFAWDYHLHEPGGGVDPGEVGV